MTTPVASVSQTPLTDAVVIGQELADGNYKACWIGLVEHARRLELRLSDCAPKWRRPDVDPPADEQKVLGYWAPNTMHREPIFESLTYTAADAPDGPDVWRDRVGDKSGAPDLWAPLEALGVPK
jgi:hypothetical protein